jgi:hypothetical protein
VEQGVLCLLTLVAAFNAGSARGAGGATPYLPHAQAQALQVLMLALTLICTGALAYAKLKLGQFRELDAWKRSALLAVLALTALFAVLRYVAWSGGSAAAGGVLALAGLLFAGTLLLLLHLLRSFFAALLAACRAEAAAAETVAEGGSKAVARVFSVRNPMLRSPAVAVRAPLGRGRGAVSASEWARQKRYAEGGSGAAQQDAEGGF